MPLRTSRQARKRLARASFESLERRTLLTAIVNGIFTDTGSNIFEYKQEDGSSVRISVFGNITAEFIGARMPDASFDPIIRNLVPAGTDGDGVDLFSIYVVKSDINSVIAIAQVPDPSAQVRFMQPFNGSAGQLSVFNATNGETEQVALGPGQVYLGARTHDFQDQDVNDRPIITPTNFGPTPNRRAFGLRPASAGQMFAGLEVAAGNDLGKFLLGGTITGLVDIQGNCRLFYAGTIATGDAGGIASSGSAGSVANNFYVNGDLEQLIVGASLGTAPGLEQEEIEDIVYKVGTKVRVHGRLGYVRAVDSFLGSIVVDNASSVTGLGIAQSELEFSGVTLNAQSPESYFDPSFFGQSASLGTKARNALYNNDSFDSAQYLGALFSSELRSRESIQITGFTDTTHNDEVDYYAVALLGGQTVEVQLLNTPTSAIGIFDPDGRLIHTDYSNGADRLIRKNKPFKFTADRPGSYRFAIANLGDINFNGVADPDESISSTSPDFYELRIRGVGNLALGGLTADVHIATTDLGNDGITVRNGDIGAVRAGILGTGTIFSVSNPWLIENGNLRSVEAVSMGIVRSSPTLTLVGQGPDFFVPRGNIGLLRTTGTDDTNTIMFVNQTLVSIDDDLSLIDPDLAVGGHIQLIDCASNLQSSFLTNRGIGMIRAASVAGLVFAEPGVWAVNVDQSGSDGRINLIDVAGDFGLLGPGGPAIVTGPNGDVEYMRVGGQTFRDRFFGGGSPEPTVFQPGEIVSLTDDNGTEVVMRSIPRTAAIDPTTGFPTGGLNNPGSLTVLSYPIRDKAGVVIMRVTANPGANGAGRGIQIDSGSRGSGGSVAIGEIIVNSAGTDQVFNPFTRAFVAGPLGQNSDVVLRGGSPIDVWSIECRDPGSGAFTGLTRVVNGTSGEIVNVQASHIGLIDAESVGMARQRTGAAIQGQNVVVNGFPFNQQRNIVAAVDPAGHIVQVRSRRSLGNIFAQGSIGSIVANSDSRNVAGVFEGIAGIIAAVPPAGATEFTGNIVNVSVGEGLLPSGSGDVAFGGLYADNIIDRVRNTGLGSDIRGDIVALGHSPSITQTVNGVVLSTPNFYIGDIQITNGAIIDSDIMTVDSFLDSREHDNRIVVPQRTDPLNAPIFDIRSITLSGSGGIIGSNIVAEDVGLITVERGFGVITTLIRSLGDSVIDGIVTDGYGVRSSLISGGANLNRVVARGTGKRLDTREFTPSVRNSERMAFDPLTGYQLDGSNDLHKYLGTTAANPKRVGLSDAGVIEDTQMSGSRSLNLIDAHRIIGRDVIEIDPFTGQRRRIPSGRVDYPMRISFGQSTGTIRTRHYVDGLALITGGLNLFSPGGEVYNTAINVTGRIRQITAGGNLRGSVSIKAQGSQGMIDSITTRRAMFASVETSLDLRNLTVGTDLGSALIRARRHLQVLNVGGSILSGANVIVGRTLEQLTIGGDIQDGARIQADAINEQDIGGQVLGDIVIV